MGFLDRILGKSRPAEDPVAADDVRYMSWFAAEDACPTCRAMDGMILLPGTRLHAPHPACEHQRGCECSEVVFFASETSPRDSALERLIESNGGMISSAMLDDYWAKCRAEDPVHQARTLQHEAAELASKARQAEDSKELVAAADLYVKSIRIHRQAAELIPDDAFSLRDLPYLYERLSLVLERDGRNVDCFASIREYDGLDLEPLESMTKRVARVQKRLDT